MARPERKVWAAETPGERLMIIRRRHPMSQSELAGKLADMGVPIDRSMIARFEAETRRPSLVHLLAIARILGVTLEDLGVTADTYPEMRLLKDPETLSLIEATRV